MTTNPPIQSSPETAAAVELLRDLCRGFTSHHAELAVHGADVSHTKAILAIRCHPFDFPKLVGGKGKHHRAIQTIFSTIGQRLGRDMEFTLLPVERREKQPDEFRADEQWNPEPMRKLLDRVLAMAFGATACSLELTHDGDVSTFVVNCPEDVFGRIDFHLAVHAIFHAIGKTQGRLVHVEFKAAEAAVIA
jgi:predicted RNA-binding protein YlqC (UPF0109 family)